MTLFVIGRFVQQKKRPMLVKLNSAWDGRVVLSGVGKLKNSDEFRHVFTSTEAQAACLMSNSHRRSGETVRRIGGVN